jgi:hypothetical protein
MLLRRSRGSRKLLLLSEYNLLFTIIPQSITKKINSFAEHLQAKQDIKSRSGVWLQNHCIAFLPQVESVLLVYSHSNGWVPNNFYQFICSHEPIHSGSYQLSLKKWILNNEYIKFKKIIFKKNVYWFVHVSKWIHPFDNYIIWPGSLALMYREPITLRNLLMRARLQDRKVCVT